MKIKIGSAYAGQGKKGKGFIDITNRPDGSMIRLPIIIVNGASRGPTLCIDGCVHGTELEGCEAIMKFGIELDPKEVRGIVIMVPMLNSQAVEARSRVSPAASREFPSGGDVNLSFPGRRDGGIQEKIAHAYFSSCVSKADYLITCHNTGIYGAPVEHVHTSFSETNQEINKKSLELAKAFGLERIAVMEKLHPGSFNQRGLMVQATEHNVCTILVEIGAHSDRYMHRQQYVAKFIKGFKNVMMHIGMLDGKPDLPKKQWIYTYTWRRSQSSGLWLPEVKVGDWVKKGTVIGRIVNPFFGDEIERVEAPYEGIVAGVHAYPIVDPSDINLFGVGKVLEVIKNE